MALPVVFHSDYTVPLPPGHRFPIGKFGRIKDVLLEDGVIAPSDLVEPVPATRAWLTRAHDEAYVDAVMALALDCRAVRRLGLPLSEALVRRGRAAVGGTVLAGRLALAHGVASVIEEQVTNGVAVRMALLYQLLTGGAEAPVA